MYRLKEIKHAVSVTKEDLQLVPKYSSLPNTVKRNFRLEFLADVTDALASPPIVIDTCALNQFSPSTN